MKPMLDTIDGAIKCLVTPVTMLVAAALLSRGLDIPDANPTAVKAIMVLLSLWAFGYMTASALQESSLQPIYLNGSDKTMCHPTA